MPDTEYRKLRIEFKRQLKIIRGHVSAANLFIESGDLLQAYQEAEKIQMTGFDAKDLLGKLVQERSMPQIERAVNDRD